MSFPDLRAFIDQLRRANDLVTVDAPVDAQLEVAEIHRRVIAAGGPALLFTNVIGSDFRLVTNLFGTARRAEIAFGQRPMQLVRRIVQLAEELLPPSAAGLWSARDVGFELFKIGSRKVGHGPVVERMTSDVRLDRLPVLTCWPEDGGPFVTLPLVYTTHPDRRGPQPRHVSHAGVRAAHDRDALADREGRRLSLRRCRSARSAASGHRVPRRTAGADSLGHRAAA